jgi:hypothetical protein
MPMALPSVHSMLPAMVIMAVPAFLICAGITLMAYRRRSRD